MTERTAPAIVVLPGNTSYQDVVGDDFMRDVSFNAVAGTQDFDLVSSTRRNGPSFAADH